MPPGPSSRYRSAHFFAVRHETSYRSAARAGGQPWSTTRRAKRRRARGVRAALAWVAWDTKASWVAERFLDSSTPHRGGLRPSTGQTVSSHDLDQRAWASHLAARELAQPTPIATGA